ncbi:MAG: hypothetical protein HQL66_00570 [Magnetococcales bacterium]|nr:hypothetical protein [Magnetococcales bacterium]
MSRRRKGEVDPRQLTLPFFELPARVVPGPGALRIDPEVREIVARTLMQAGGREAVAEKMSQYLGQEVAKTTLDAMTAQSKPGYRFPLGWGPAFALATGNFDLLKHVVKASGCLLLLPDEVMYAEIGRLVCAEESARRRKESIMGMECGRKR